MQYKVVIEQRKNDKRVEKFNDIINEDKVIEVLRFNIRNSELFPDLILKDSIQFGESSDWDEYSGYGYNIIKIQN